MENKFEGVGSAADLFGDRVIFRSLRPLDPGLPGLEDLRKSLGIREGRTPRKIDFDYGRVVAGILTAAQNQFLRGKPIQELVYLGDTPGSDGAAFSNILAAGKWRGALFIGEETGKDPGLEIQQTDPWLSATGTHWAAVQSFESRCRAAGFRLGEGTALIIDLDKTLLGARGRNDSPINDARVAAVNHTVRDLLGNKFDRNEFQRNYRILNQNDLHFFTGDNQDFVVFICVILGSGLINVEELLRNLRDEWNGFDDFANFVAGASDQLPAGLQEFQVGFMAAYREGDPTPLKRFRRQEYLETISRLQPEENGAAVPIILKDKIALTAEIYQLGKAWHKQGALLMGLSDKPDEASIPTSEGAAEGLRPIHRTEAFIIGSTGAGR